MTRSVTTIADGLAFAEGLRWHEGALWFSDMHAGEVHSWSTESGDTVVAQVPGSVSGLGWAPNGELLVVSMDDRRLLQVDDTGRPVTVADLGAYTPHAINDMAVDADGRAYIGTFGFDFHACADFQTGLLLQVDPDGAHRIAADDLWFPNGMVLTDLGRTLVVAETFAGRLTAFAHGEDGSLTDRRVWAELPSGVIPDGICLDADGAIWISSTTTSECLRVVEGGDIVDRVAVGDRMAVTCTLGGDEGRTLFIATSIHLSPDDTRRHRTSRIEATIVEIEAP